MKRLYCTAFDCLVRTCHYHRCHLTRRIRVFDWVDRAGTCGMYKSKNCWKTFYEPPEREDDYDEEDL